MKPVFLSGRKREHETCWKHPACHCGRILCAFVTNSRQNRPLTDTLCFLRGGGVTPVDAALTRRRTATTAVNFRFQRATRARTGEEIMQLLSAQNKKVMRSLRNIR